MECLLQLPFFFDAWYVANHSTSQDAPPGALLLHMFYLIVTLISSILRRLNYHAKTLGNQPPQLPPSHSFASDEAIALCRPLVSHDKTMAHGPTSINTECYTVCPRSATSVRIARSHDGKFEQQVVVLLTSRMFPV